MLPATRISKSSRLPARRTPGLPWEGNFVSHKLKILPVVLITKVSGEFERKYLNYLDFVTSVPSCGARVGLAGHKVTRH